MVPAVSRTLAYHPHKLDDKRRAQDEAERRDDQFSIEEVDDVCALMSTPQGRRTAFRLLSLSGHIHAESSSDDGVFNATVSVMNRASGRRDVGHRIDLIIRHHCNDQWLLMLAENTVPRGTHGGQR